MRTFKINRDPNDMGCNIFKKSTISLNPGVTVLVGCNGIGKTTLIRQLKTQLKQAGIPTFSFDNLHDGGSHARQKAEFCGRLDFLVPALLSSEGENICMNIGEIAGEIGRLQASNPNAKEIWVFLDAIDSGLSVDNVIELKDLFALILEHRRATDIYIIISANEYELARGEACFDVLAGMYISFDSYETYRAFILKTRTAKDNRKYNSK